MKTLDDYKKIVKILKLKIKTLQSEQAEMQKLSNLGRAFIVDDQTAIAALKQNAQQIGLTPEMVYRAADVNSLQIMSTTQLGQAFHRMLRMNDQQVNQLVHMFDIDKSGSVSLSEYMETLEQYGMRSEGSSSYMRNAFIKFVQFVCRQKFEGALGYAKMDPQRIGYIKKEIFMAFTSCLHDYENTMNGREVQAAYCYLDVNRNGRVTKEYYLSCFNAAMKVPELKPTKESQEEWLVRINEQLKKLLLIKGYTLSQFMLKLMKSLTNPTVGILYSHFQSVAQEFITKPSEILALFKIMDIGLNGAIDYDEMMIFYQYTMQSNDNFNILFVILARKLQAINLTIQQYLMLEQMYDYTELTINQFKKVAIALFNCQTNQIIEKLFDNLDIDNSNTVTTNEIISYVEDAIKKLSPEIEMPKLQDRTYSAFHHNDEPEQLKQANIQDLESTIHKNILVNDDYFTRNGNGNWSTILNSESACLRKAFDIIATLPPDTQWDDPEFGPNGILLILNQDNDPNGSQSLYFSVNNLKPGWPDPEDIEWSRPDQLVDNWSFLDEQGANANDVMQSKYLGNCWFVSALSIIACDDRYLVGRMNSFRLLDKLGVHPKAFHFLHKYGIYVFRFYKNYQWRYILIDSKVPTYNRQILYGQCRNESEWWVQLTEKAYAKLHNCYEALIAGDIGQGLADLTGLIATKHNIQTNYNLYKLLNTGIGRSLMGCSANGTGQIQLDDEDTGIYAGHAYSILDVFELPDENMMNDRKTHRLLKIRNPWGYGEWKLKWSEQSDILEQYIDQIDQYYTKIIEECNQEGYEPPERYERGEDGIFLINFKNFSRTFNNLFICLNLDKTIWSGIRYQSTFTKDNFGCPTKSPESQISYANSNPKYIVEVNSEQEIMHLFIQIGQPDGRLQRNECYPYNETMLKVMLCVFKLDEEEQELTMYDGNKKIADSSLLSNRREVDTGMFRIDNGRYAIIPCTHKQGQVGDYYLSIYYDIPSVDIKIVSHDNNLVGQPIVDLSEDNIEFKQLIQSIQ